VTDKGVLKSFDASDIAYLKTADLSLFISQLALTLRCGLPLAKALEVLADSGNPTFERVANRLLFDIMAGFTLSGAMARQPRSFSRYWCAAVQASEVSGRLVACLERLAETMGKRLALWRRLKGSLVYPCVLALACFLMVLLVLYLVFPMVVKVTAQTGVEPPALTGLLIKLSSPNILFAVAGLGFLLINAMVLILRDEGRASGLRRLVEMGTPPGHLLTRSQVSDALRQLALLIDAGIDLGRALLVAAQVAERSVLVSEAVGSIRGAVMQGSELSAAFDQYAVFPSLVGSLARVGEEGGTLARSLTQAADLIEQRLEQQVEVLSSLVEPTLMGLAGICVGIVLLGAFMPLYNLTAL